METVLPDDTAPKPVTVTTVVLVFATTGAVPAVALASPPTVHVE